MRIVVLYRPKSETSRRVEEYLRDFTKIHNDQTLEAINIDSPEGSSMAQIYGITDHPSILALRGDGQLQQMWQGLDSLPLMNDLAYYAQQ